MDESVCVEVEEVLPVNNSATSNFVLVTVRTPVHRTPFRTEPYRSTDVQGYLCKQSSGQRE